MCGWAQTAEGGMGREGNDGCVEGKPFPSGTRKGEGCVGDSGGAYLEGGGINTAHSLLLLNKNAHSHFPSMFYEMCIRF